ncbi:MAG TPA: class I SAM-dependent methyltransferase [Puia sp.]|nr:class I SAM-dependent methyltransferase [Puia sp.]
MKNSNDIFNNQPASTFPETAFEKIYLNTRQKESRLYSDMQVASLPSIDPSHLHSKEWAVRKRSSLRLLKYLDKKKKPLIILEVGCGNGWLCGMMSSLQNTRVTGSDVNNSELDQAKRVFFNRTNLEFESGDFRNMDLNRKFDVIIFAASIQYFPIFDSTVNKALTFLNRDGEIHILDSRFYDPDELEQARQRSYEYYDSLGNGEMAKHYFHHELISLNRFKHRFLFSPYKFISKIIFKKDPFPWIRITSG